MQYLFVGNINPRIQNKTSKERWTRSVEKQWTTLRNELTFVVQFHDQMNKLPFNRLITDQIHKQQLVGQQKLSLVFPNSCKYYFLHAQSQIQSELSSKKVGFIQLTLTIVFPGV